MSADSAEGSDHFDLLPFIGILMCVLGCLLLVTLSMAAISLGGAGEVWTPPAAEAKTSATNPNGMVLSQAVVDKIPILIEWDGTAAVIHRDDKMISVKWSHETSDADKDFQKALAELVALRETHYALFAVRPSGFETFQAFADEFRHKKIKVGFKPLHQSRPVRL